MEGVYNNTFTKAKIIIIPYSDVIREETHYPGWNQPDIKVEKLYKSKKKHNVFLLCFFLHSHFKI